MKVQRKNPFENMALCNFDTRIVKVVQVTHHQADIRYGMSKGIPVLMYVTYVGLLDIIWDSFDLDCILEKGDFLFTSLNNYRYFRMEDLPQELFIENLSINLEFLNNIEGEVRGHS